MLAKRAVQARLGFDSVGKHQPLIWSTGNGHQPFLGNPAPRNSIRRSCPFRRPINGSEVMKNHLEQVH